MTTTDPTPVVPPAPTSAAPTVPLPPTANVPPAVSNPLPTATAPYVPPVSIIPFDAAAFAATQAAHVEQKNKKQTAKANSKAKQASIDIRKLHWPEVKDEDLWLLDAATKKRGGFSQVPRTLALMLNIINNIAKRMYGKSIPAGKTYLVLWMYHFSEGLVKIHSEAVAAYEAGYDGQRNVTTFRAHMKLLQEIGFIDYRKGPKGPMQYVLMRSPYKVLKKLHGEKDKNGMQLVSDEEFAAVIERVNDIGSRDELED
jgi:hypothetical protein